MDDDLTKAKSYSKTKHRLAIIEVLIYISFFIIIQLGGFSSYMAEIVNTAVRNDYLAMLIYVSGMALFLNIATFPVAFLSSFKAEHKFGLSKQNFASWFKDYIKALAVGGFISLVMMLILYSFLRTSSPLWWLYTALIYFFLSVILAKIFPVAVIPLFYKLEKMSQPRLKERLISLAEKGGVKILDIYRIALGEKTRKANAALCGLGETKRILVSDTLLQDYNEDEIESTIAHELAHYKRRHFWKLSLYNFAFTLLSFYFAGILLKHFVMTGAIEHIYDIKIFPLLAVIFILYNILTKPLLNFISRRYESEADRDAVGLTEKPDAFINLMKKLTLQNLSDPQPAAFIKFFFYDHPPAAERIMQINA